jgi:hypothetical protein
MSTPLKTDHYVRTADGTLGWVRYVHEALDQADLYLYDDHGKMLDRVTLPVAELTRTTAPWEKKPAIEGRPETNLLCICCGKKMPWRIEHTYGTVAGRPAIVRRTFRQWTGYPRHAPLFCTLRCALAFARAAYAAGYRITKGGAK